LTIVIEFYKGASAIAQKPMDGWTVPELESRLTWWHVWAMPILLIAKLRGPHPVRSSAEKFAMAVVELTHRNTRRYGGYLIHMGIVLVFIGITGAAFDHNATFEVKTGDRMKIGSYDLRMVDVHQNENAVYSAATAVIDVYKNGEKITTLEPERRFYKASQQPLAEIGIRRALGATQSDILRQFLAESLLQCLIGGAIGILLGFACALALRTWTSFPASVQTWVALLGVALSSLIGLFFGIYPARKAALLDPVAALRTEIG